MSSDSFVFCASSTSEMFACCARVRRMDISLSSSWMGSGSPACFSILRFVVSLRRSLWSLNIFE